MSLIRPRGDLFRVVLPKDFIPQHIQNIWDPYVNRLPNIIENSRDLIDITLQSIDVPQLNFEPLVQQQPDQGEGLFEQIHRATIHSQELVDKELTLTFKMTDGYVNYWILLQTMMYYYSRKNPNGHFGPVSVHVVDHEGLVMMQVDFESLVFRGLSEYTLSYAQIQQDFMNFTVTLNFNEMDIKFPKD